MGFAAGVFLVGMVGALGPLAIHLLNKRRYRVVQWAAMNFLVQAVQKNRRVLEIRDLLLLLLRTAAIIFFVLAMARPFLSGGIANNLGGNQPVHLVMVVDNSLSMQYQTLDRSLLDQAKEEAIAIVEALPQGSYVSLLPTCPSSTFAPSDIYRDPARLEAAIMDLQLADQSTSLAQMSTMIKEAKLLVPEMPTKRVVYLGDMQANTWEQADLKEQLGEVEHLQVVALGKEDRSNGWVDRFELRDGMADATTPTVFFATLRYEGKEPRLATKIKFTVDDQMVDQRVVDLQPGQHLQLTFKHQFEVAGTSLEPLFAQAKLELGADHLAADDVRHLVVPVIARVPVLFIDDLGSIDEKPQLNQYGQSFRLRRLLESDDAYDANRKLVSVKHLKMYQVERSELAEARLVVIAGVEKPEERVLTLLREYIEQGGQLLIIPGGKFDPVAWQRLAWADGASVLPIAIKADKFGELPTRAKPNPGVFNLKPEAMNDEVFYLNLDQSQRERLLLNPFFYQSIQVDEAVLDNLAQADQKRIDELKEWLSDYEAMERELAEKELDGTITETELIERDQARLKREELLPDWLKWRNPLANDQMALPTEELVKRMKPRVMGRYDNNLAFAVKRQIGKGSSVLLTSDMAMKWNSMPGEYAIVLIDQLMRQMITSSVPGRNLSSTEGIQIPIASADLSYQFFLKQPGTENLEQIQVEAFGSNLYGLRLRDIQQRGIYEIICKDAAQTVDQNRWVMRLAVNGAAGESNVSVINRERFDELKGDAEWQWTELNTDSLLAGASWGSQQLWQVFIVLCLMCIMAEMFILAWPSIKRGGAA